MKTNTCQKCEKPFFYEPTFFQEREIFPPTVCDSCEQLSRVACEKQMEAERRRRSLSRWESLCPEEYRGTDIFRLPKRYQTGIQRWRFGAKGVAFVGDPGIGKTRAAFSILHREHFVGRKCHAIGATRLSAVAIEKYDDNHQTKGRARDEIHQCHAADVLFIDDLGKGKFTDRAEEELYDTLEIRTSKRRPTLWTANSSGDDLLSKFSQERGAAILRRLLEFSEIL